MSTEMIWQTASTSSADTERLGMLLGSRLKGGEVFELIADLGGGKTTFTKGLLKGLGSSENVSSPTFTISREYVCRDNIRAHHFDFYRLPEAGILAEEIQELVQDEQIVLIVEWAEPVHDFLPAERFMIEFKLTPHNQDERNIIIHYPESFAPFVEQVENDWNTQ